MKGDILLISFPFTDFSGTKVRPAVILMETELDVTVAFITSQFKWREPFDLILSPSAYNGLKSESLVRISKIGSIDKKLILGQIGKLSNQEILQLDQLLKLALHLS